MFRVIGIEGRPGLTAGLLAGRRADSRHAACAGAHYTPAGRGCAWLAAAIIGRSRRRSFNL